MSTNLIACALSIIAVSIVGCSERKKNAAPEPPPQKNQEAVISPEHEPKPEQGTSVQRGIPIAFSKQFMKLRGDGPKLPIYIQIRNEMWTPELSEPYAEEDALKIANRPIGENSVIAKIRAGGTVHGIERESVIGYTGLLMGWLLDDQNKQDIHFLLKKRAKDPQLTKGDVMLATLAPECANLACAGGKLSESQKAEWGKLANAENPIVRQLAAQFVGVLASDTQDRIEFFLNYGDEPQAEVLETIATAVKKLPPELANEVIQHLLDRQKAAGHVENSEFLKSQVVER